MLADQRNDFFQSPNVIGNARFHCGCDAQGLVNAAEVVIHEMDGCGVFVAFQFLAECVGQARKAAVTHAQREVLPLNVAGGNVQALRLSRDANFARSNTNGRGIARFALCHFVPIEFDQLRKINFRTESAFNGSDVCFVSIAGELNPLRQPFCEIVNELVGVARSAFADVEAGNQFSFGINGNPSPCVPDFFGAFQMGGNILLLGVSEAPNFIDLQQFAVQSAHRFVHVIGAGRASGDKQAFNGFLGCASQSAGAAHGATFNQTIQDLCAFVSGENIHLFPYLTNCLTETNFLSNILFNKNENENENGSAKASKGKSKGRANRRSVRSRGIKTSSRCGAAFRRWKVRMDSENLAGCGGICQCLASLAELEGIKPSAFKVTVQRRRQTSPRSGACGWRGSLLKKSPRQPFSFVGGLLRRHKSPSSLLIQNNFLRRTINCAGNCLTSSILTAGRRIAVGSGRFRSIPKKRAKVVVLLLLFALACSFTNRRFDGLVGDVDHVAQDRVHSHVRVRGSALNGLLHAMECKGEITHA